MTEDPMITYCIEKAKLAPYQKGRYRHYCVITNKKGIILSEAANSYDKTNTTMFYTAQKLGIPGKTFGHAEQLAIGRLRTKERNLKLTVVRINKTGKPVNSKPCPICDYLITEHKQIKTVLYSN
jgi:tRNA(Arg) A34 adenosine deaminase TadA